MKTALALIVVFSLALGLPAQSNGGPPPGSAAAGPNLNTILSDLQRTTQAVNGDLSRLRIERWKADGTEKQQMQQVVESLQKNITMAVPGLINDLQAAPGSVSKAFKLYHDMNVVYEFMNSLAEAAGAYGKREEYEPLANDASALDKARQNLSGYIEQTANNLEIQARKPAPPASTQAAQAPKKVVIDDDTPAPKKTRKKKPSTASAPSSSSSSSPPQ